MGTDLSESRHERRERSHWDDSPLRKFIEGDDLEESDTDKIKYQGKHRSKDTKKRRREDEDHRSRDKDRLKTKDGLKESEKEVKDFGNGREGIEDHGNDRTKDKGRENYYYRDKQRGRVRDRDEKDRERKRVRENERENEPESDRQEKDTGKDKERHMLDRENYKVYIREIDREVDHGKERSKDRGKLSKRSRVDHNSNKDGAKDDKAKGDSHYNRDKDAFNQGKTFLEEDDFHIRTGDYVEDSSADQDQSWEEIEEGISKIKEERLKRKSEGVSEILSWVNKSRKLEEKIDFERRKAKQRSSILDEQDNVNEEDDDDDEGFTKSKGATDGLAGVKVLHRFDKVLEGGSVVLTLKDQEILAGGDLNENVDVLENVEIGEQKHRDEAYKAGKKIPGIYYDKFNDQLGEEKKMLPQYDDPAQEEGITLDATGRVTANNKIEQLRKKLQIPSDCNHVEDLNSSVRISSDYYTPEEMLQFKKPKKQKSLRKREKLDIDALETEARAEGLGASDLHSRSDSKSQIAKEEEERAEAKRRSCAYQAAFAKADEASRALRTNQRLSIVDEEDDADVFAEDLPKYLERTEKLRKLASKNKTEKQPIGPEAIAHLATSAASSQCLDAQNSIYGDALENKVVFAEMQGFVWGLQLEEDTQKPNHVFMEEDEALKASVEKKDETGGWTEGLKSGISEPSKTEIKEEIVVGYAIHEAPVGNGLSNALKLLQERGALKETIEWSGRNVDEKKNKQVKKEAYRVFSHKFHGKGPGKRKQEKRLKQYQDELKLKQLTTSDALPPSVEGMREAQLLLKTPYLVLSGHVKPGFHLHLHRHWTCRGCVTRGLIV